MTNADTTQLAHFEDRPFFEKALRYGLAHQLITSEKIEAINLEAPKGMVQIATAFGSPYLRAELELARVRIVNLVSLYLNETSHGDLAHAARLIRDHTFLTLSRGGSTLLKELFKLPEYPVLGATVHGHVEDFLEFWSRKKTQKDYQQIKAQRLRYQREIQLAEKFAHAMHLSSAVFLNQHCEADALIRSKLLLTMQKKAVLQPKCFDQFEFAQLLDTMRKKGFKQPTRSDVALTDEEAAIVDELQHDILTQDIPLITNKSLPLDHLINQLKNRYFFRDHDVEDTASFDALVSKEWSKYTKGMHDVDAIFTLLLCVAAKVPNKVNLSESAAKTLIRKVRKQGFFPELANQFIKRHAPFEQQQSLLEDWADFSEQAKIYLLDDYDGELHGAMNFLRENCYIGQ